jgi:hypothetical protein
MAIHMNRATDVQAVGEIDIDKMKRYISYCKAYVCSAALRRLGSSLLQPLRTSTDGRGIGEAQQPLRLAPQAGPASRARQ